jgi:hypothetical protein
MGHPHCIDCVAASCDRGVGCWYQTGPRTRHARSCRPAQGARQPVSEAPDSRLWFCP